jgi:DNA-directed RNA polymerase sigma subunit (sigma70/sigma32)
MDRKEMIAEMHATLASLYAEYGDRLVERERIVVAGRVAGLTLKASGAKIGVSRERARQLEFKAWRKMAARKRGRA